jgi:hypothetical protein
LEASDLADTRLEVLFAWPWLTTFETLSFCLGFAYVHRDTLATECANLVQVDFCWFGRCGRGRLLLGVCYEGTLVGDDRGIALLAFGDVLEDLSHLSEGLLPPIKE